MMSSWTTGSSSIQAVIAYFIASAQIRIALNFLLNSSSHELVTATTANTTPSTEIVGLTNQHQHHLLQHQQQQHLPYNYHYHHQQQQPLQPHHQLAEQRLIQNLLRGYDTDARGVDVSANETIRVEIQLLLLRIQGLDERSQVLTSTGLIICDWTDSRLRWPTEEYDDLVDVVVKPERIWLPELALMNGAEELAPDFRKVRVMLRHDGHVHWEPGGVFTTTCDIDIRYFPFDDQSCPIQFGAWAYYSSRMNITNSGPDVQTQGFRLNGEWAVYKTRAEWKENVLPCCPDTRYPYVEFTLYLRRRHEFYVMNIIVPCTLLSVLVMIVFCLPPDAGEKISLGISVLLAFSVFLLMVAESIPRTSLHVPIIVIYLTCTMGLGTLSVCLTVLVLNLHYRDPERRMPNWMRLLLLRYLVRVVGGISVHSLPSDLSEWNCGTKFRNNVGRHCDHRHRRRRSSSATSTSGLTSRRRHPSLSGIDHQSRSRRHHRQLTAQHTTTTTASMPDEESSCRVSLLVDTPFDNYSSPSATQRHPGCQSSFHGGHSHRCCCCCCHAHQFAFSKTDDPSNRLNNSNGTAATSMPDGRHCCHPTPSSAAGTGSPAATSSHGTAFPFHGGTSSDGAYHRSPRTCHCCKVTAEASTSRTTSSSSAAAAQYGDDIDATYTEWKDAAKVLDRLFFWIVFIAMTASALIILLVPFYKVDTEVTSSESDSTTAIET